MTRARLAAGAGGLCLVCSVLLASAGGCGAPAPVPDRPLVIVSVVPQRWFAERLAGDLVGIEVMIPPGASPALYEPTLAQVRALSRAALYVKVGHPGFPFEQAWLERLLGESAGLRVVDSSRGAEIISRDPHLWLAPAPARLLADELARALAALLPGHAPAIQANAVALRADIDALDRQLAAMLAPVRGQRFFVFHPALGYLAAAYGLEQVAIERHGKEPGPHDLAELIKSARTSRVETIFVQPQFDPQSAQLLAREIGAQVRVLDPLAPDWDENLREAARAIAGAARP